MNVKINLPGSEWLALFNFFTGLTKEISDFRNDIALTLVYDWLTKKIFPRLFELSIKYQKSPNKQFKQTINYIHAIALWDVIVRLPQTNIDFILRKLMMQLDPQLLNLQKETPKTIFNQLKNENNETFGLNANNQEL